MSTPLATAHQTHIEDVRNMLMETLRQLTNRGAPMEVDRARAVAQVAGVLVDSARVEVDFLRATGGKVSTHLGDRTAQVKQIATGVVQQTANGRIHRIAED